MTVLQFVHTVFKFPSHSPRIWASRRFGFGRTLKWRGEEAVAFEKSFLFSTRNNYQIITIIFVFPTPIVSHCRRRLNDEQASQGRRRRVIIYSLLLCTRRAKHWVTRTRLITGTRGLCRGVPKSNKTGQKGKLIIPDSSFPASRTAVVNSMRVSHKRQPPIKPFHTHLEESK